MYAVCSSSAGTPTTPWSAVDAEHSCVSGPEQTATTSVDGTASRTGLLAPTTSPGQLAQMTFTGCNFCCSPLTLSTALRALCLRLAPPRLRPDAEVSVRAGALHFGTDAACLPLVHGSRHSSSRQVGDQNHEANRQLMTANLDLKTLTLTLQTTCLCPWHRVFRYLPCAQREMCTRVVLQSEPDPDPDPSPSPNPRPNPAGGGSAACGLGDGLGGGGLHLRPWHPHDARAFRGADRLEAVSWRDS